jgi:hypothetical protein
MRGHLKLAAVLIVVVMALTGFSPAKSGGGKGRSGKSSSGGGGGCSSSKKSNGSSSYRDHDDDDADDSSGSGSGDSYSSEPTTEEANAFATVVDCVNSAGGYKKRKKRSKTSLSKDAVAKVEIESRAPTAQTFVIYMNFLSSSGGTVVDTGYATVDLKFGEPRTVEVAMDAPSKASKVGKCEIDRIAQRA